MTGINKVFQSNLYEEYCVEKIITFMKLER